MTDTGWVIAIGYSALVLVFVTIGLIVFRSTRVGFRVKVTGREEVEKREGYWGIAVITFLVLVLAGTIFSVPYFDNNEDAPQKVTVTSRQFAFTVDPPRIDAGVETEFNVDAADVNHAVGLYNPDNTLIKQVNVLPGVTQSFTITLNQPGSYTLRCLEFCGIDHHLMQNQLQVTR